uniref:NRDE family protein n=1 Tax=Halomonas sp. TaxID=1486246 RepID=UPI00262FB176|nr:NRDE family protein [Halomonas sp.]
MCLIAFQYDPASTMPLVLVANRDEYHQRPTLPLAEWPDAPGLFAGRDLQAGGTWLAVHRNGRIAAITNVRAPGMEAPAQAPSRGHLVRAALEAPDLEAWLRQARDEAQAYAGFNLLVGSPSGLWHLTRNHREVCLSAVTPGIHGLSNASLDTPWPKVRHATQALAQDLAQAETSLPMATKAFLDPLQAEDNELPDTGISLDKERFLSSSFIVSEEYGTRAMTRLILHRTHHQAWFNLHEKAFASDGRIVRETQRQVMIDNAHWHAKLVARSS